MTMFERIEEMKTAVATMKNDVAQMRGMMTDHADMLVEQAKRIRALEGSEIDREQLKVWEQADPEFFDIDAVVKEPESYTKAGHHKLPSENND